MGKGNPRSPPHQFPAGVRYKGCMEVATPPCSIFLSRWTTRGGSNPPPAFDELAGGCIDRVPPVRPSDRPVVLFCCCRVVVGPFSGCKTRLNAARFFFTCWINLIRKPSITDGAFCNQSSYLENPGICPYLANKKKTKHTNDPN